MFGIFKRKRQSPKEVFEKGFAAEQTEGIDKALPFYKQAAEQGYAGAQYTLAKYCYYLANNLHDPEKAEYWKQRLLQQKEEQSGQAWPTHTRRLYGRDVLEKYARFDISPGK